MLEARSKMRALFVSDAPWAQEEKELAPSKFTLDFLYVFSGSFGPGARFLVGAEYFGGGAFLLGIGGAFCAEKLNV